jgi:hypothetical protein
MNSNRNLKLIRNLKKLLSVKGKRSKKKVKVNKVALCMRGCTIFIMKKCKSKQKK